MVSGSERGKRRRKTTGGFVYVCNMIKTKVAHLRPPQTPDVLGAFDDVWSITDILPPHHCGTYLWLNETRPSRVCVRLPVRALEQDAVTGPTLSRPVGPFRQGRESSSYPEPLVAEDSQPWRGDHLSPLGHLRVPHSTPSKGSE